MVFTPVAQGAAAKTENEKALSSPSREIASVDPRKSGPDITMSQFNFNIDKAMVQEYFKFTGLGGKKKITVGEFYTKMRPLFPKTQRNDWDRWATLNHNSLMPDIQVTSYKASEGKDQVRMLLTMPDKKVVTLSFDPNSDKSFVKYNNVNLSKKDIIYYEQAARKVATFDKDVNASVKNGAVNRFRQPVKLSYEEYKRFTPAQRAEYIVNLRYLVESSQEALKVFRGGRAMNERERKQEYVVQQFLGQFAEADEDAPPRVGDRCMVNGYFSVYGETSSCGGGKTGKANLMSVIPKADLAGCPKNHYPCNGLVYAYSSSDKPFCVKNEPDTIRFATSDACAVASPLRKRTPEEIQKGDKKRLAEEIADKKRIVESYLKKQGKGINLQFNDEGKISEEQHKLIEGYLNELNAYVDLAAAKCNTMPLSSNKRADQRTACDAIALRKITIDTIAITPPPIPVVVVPGKRPEPEPPLDCAVVKPGSLPDNGQCVCEGPTLTSAHGSTCVTEERITRDPEPKKCKDNQPPDDRGNCPAGAIFGGMGLLIGVAVVAGIFALACGKKGKKSNPPPPPVPQQPFDPCPPAPYPCTGQTPPPQDPPTVMPPPIIGVGTPVPSPSPTVPVDPPVIPVTPPPPVIPPPVPEVGDLVPNTSAGGVRPGSR
jgi:hypothetical protein